MRRALFFLAALASVVGVLWLGSVMIHAFHWDRLAWLDFSAKTAHAAVLYTYKEPPVNAITFSCAGTRDTDTSNYLCDFNNFTAPQDILGISQLRAFVACDSASEVSTGISLGLQAVGEGGGVVSSTPVSLACVSSPTTTDVAAVIGTLHSSVNIHSGFVYRLWFAKDTPNASMTIGESASSSADYSHTFFDAGGPGPPPVSISFSTPADATTTTDFSEWVLSVADATTSQTTYNFHVDYSRLSSTTFDLHDTTTYTSLLPGFSSFDVAVPKTNILAYPPLLPPITYYARASIQNNATGIYLATSSVISFSVDFQTSGNSSSSVPAAQCSSSDTSFLGDIRQGICEALVYLFVPPQSSISQFTTLQNSVSSKPPFGYFVAIKDGFQSVASSTSSSSLMDASTSAVFAPIFSPIRTGLGVVMYILAGFWLYHRLRHIEL